MRPYDFVVWLTGVLETIGDRGPSKLEWELIATKLALLPPQTISVLTLGSPDSFPLWLRGFLDGTEELPTEWQWQKLRDFHGQVLGDMARDKILGGTLQRQGTAKILNPVEIAKSTTPPQSQLALQTGYLNMHRQ
jgi:hypothetical protein